MIYLIKILVHFLLPPGCFIIIPLILYSFVHNCLSTILIILSLIVLYLLSTPFISYLLILPLERKFSLPTIIHGDSIIMLGGDAAAGTPDLNGLGHLSGMGANRLIATAALYQQTELPIILSSGPVYRDSGDQSQIAKRQLIALGVPEGKILTEDTSKNTAQNARLTKAILEQHSYKKPILITSAFHMKRSILEFNKVGIQVQPYPTDYKVNPHYQIYPSLFVPKASALSLSEIAIHEYLGIIAAKLR